MKLYPPEPTVDLYKDGFGTDDFLNRRSTGKALSELVERIADPLAIVLDGPWGSGKSYFLKRWVGAHTGENSGNATTVYFDAFANDYLDDPLTGLAAAINWRLPADTQPKAKRAFKGAVATLARPALRMGLAVATAGVTEAAGSLVDAAVAAGSGELDKAVDTFWRREDGRREAMRQVERSLLEITKAPNGSVRKLVVVIDELDRCRPDYALAVLETIKHFFAVPNVHFVLGVNLSALEHSVKARYGGQIDAEGYLRRFISITMTLPQIQDRASGRSSAVAYWVRAGNAMGLSGDLIQVIEKQLLLRGTVGAASMRDVNRMLSIAALMDRFDKQYAGQKIILGSMLLAKALQPSLFQKMRHRKVSLDEINNFYGITPTLMDPVSRATGQYNPVAVMLNNVWSFALASDADTINDRTERMFGQFSIRPSELDIEQIAEANFDTFTFVEDKE